MTYGLSQSHLNIRHIPNCQIFIDNSTTELRNGRVNNIFFPFGRQKKIVVLCIQYDEILKNILLRPGVFSAENGQPGFKPSEETMHQVSFSPSSPML